MFTLATRKFKKMKAISRFKSEFWCIDLAYVAKLAGDNSVMMYLLVRQDLFDRTVDANGMKAKASKETVRAFWTMIRKQETTQQTLGRQGKRNWWEVLKTLQSWKNTNLLNNEWD